MSVRTYVRVYIMCVIPRKAGCSYVSKVSECVSEPVSTAEEQLKKGAKRKKVGLDVSSSTSSSSASASCTYRVKCVCLCRLWWLIPGLAS